MKPARCWWLLLALPALLFLGGCVNLKQEMWINPDGSGKVSVDMGVSRAFLDIAKNAPAESRRDLFQVVKEQYAASASPLVRNYASREYIDKDTQHYEVTFEVSDLLKYLEQAGQSGGSLHQAALKKLPNGNLIFTMVLDPGGQQLDLAGMEVPAASQAESLFKDDYWTVVLHTAAVVSADASASIQDGTTVTWNVPVARLLTNQEPVRLVAEVKSGITIFGGEAQSIVLIVLAVAFISGFLLFVLRRRPPAGGDSIQPYAPYPPASHRDPYK